MCDKDNSIIAYTLCVARKTSYNRRQHSGNTNYHMETQNGFCGVLRAFVGVRWKNACLNTCGYQRSFCHVTSIFDLFLKVHSGSVSRDIPLFSAHYAENQTKWLFGELPPLAISRQRPKLTLYDFGKNFARYAPLQLKILGLKRGLFYFYRHKILA